MPMALENSIKPQKKSQNHKCERCGETFGGKKALKLHVESIHEGIRHKCNLCDKEFFVAEGLR